MKTKPKRPCLKINNFTPVSILITHVMKELIFYRNKENP